MLGLFSMLFDKPRQAVGLWRGLLHIDGCDSRELGKSKGAEVDSQRINFTTQSTKNCITVIGCQCYWEAG